MHCLGDGARGCRRAGLIVLFLCISPLCFKTAIGGGGMREPLLLSYRTSEMTYHRLNANPSFPTMRRCMKKNHRAARRHGRGERTLLL
jgi:hypothetical protein